MMAAEHSSLVGIGPLNDQGQPGQGRNFTSVSWRRTRTRMICGALGMSGALILLGCLLSYQSSRSGLLQRREKALKFVKFSSGEQEAISDTCGLMEDKCGHLVGNEKTQCALGEVCRIHTTKEECNAENGDKCKELLEFKQTRLPCYWGSTGCQVRPGWGMGAGVSTAQQRVMNGTSPAAIMAAVLENAEKSEEEEKENEDAVTKVLKALGASITAQHSRPSRRRSRYGKTRQYNPKLRHYSTHTYNRGVRRSANRQFQYRQWKANYYVPRNRYGLEFNFTTGKYSDGTYPQGVWNKTFPSRKHAKVEFQNGRRLPRDFTYQRKKNKWDYHKYNHTYAHCHRPTCRIPPNDGQGRFNMHRRFRIRTGNRGTRGMNARRSHGYLREGKGVIYNGQYMRRGYYPGAPFYDGRSLANLPDFANQADLVDYEREGGGPVAKPFGKTNIMWHPNAQDCGGGGDDYDYGCWEPIDDDFEFPEVSDKDPIHVEIQWCDWGEEMVPCTPGFGGAYYLPGLRGNDRGIWPKSSGMHYQKKGPIEVYAGGRSDPYIYEEGRGYGYNLADPDLGPQSFDGNDAAADDDGGEEEADE